jgi:3-dehydroquinate synthetase
MLLHGEAVSIDMALSTELAFGRGLLTSEQRLRVLRLMRGLRLPLWHEACTLDVLMKVGALGEQCRAHAHTHTRVLQPCVLHTCARTCARAWGSQSVCTHT